MKLVIWKVFAKEVSNMNEKLKFLGLIGSLRKDSYNKALMKTSFELLPDNVTLEIFDPC